MKRLPAPSARRVTGSPVTDETQATVSSGSVACKMRRQMGLSRQAGKPESRPIKRAADSGRTEQEECEKHRKAESVPTKKRLKVTVIREASRDIWDMCKGCLFPPESGKCVLETNSPYFICGRLIGRRGIDNRRDSVIRLKGKPLIFACSCIAASSSARYMQKVLSPAT